jgi:phosphoglycolate phosphatase-like HAD superfamily hydrolase
MPIRAVVFDFGGALARGDPSFLSEAASEFDLTPEEITLVFRGPQAAENTLSDQQFGIPEIEEAITAALPDQLGARTAEAAARLVRVYSDPVTMISIPERVELLGDLQAAGIPVGCLSNGPQGVVEKS